MHVLLATDFSEGSSRAARVARRLAGADPITVVHASVPMGALAASSGLVGMAAPNVVPLLDLQPLRERLALWCEEEGIVGEQRVVEGLPGRAVAEEARRVGAHVVALGSAGATGFERFLLGASANAILRSLDCSALLARTNVAAHARVVVATDFSEPSREAARMAARLPGFAEAEVVVAHVRSDPHDDAAARLHAFNLETLGGRAAEVVLQGGPVKELVRLLAAQRADLLVIGNEGHGALRRLLLGEIAGTLVEKAPCDVLVGRPPA